MWFPIIAWIVLFSASAFFAGTTLGLSPGQISIQLSALPGPQRFALGAIMLTTLSLIGSSVWQAYSLARQNKLLRDRLRGLRQGALAAHEVQNQFDSSVQHLASNDPEEALISIQKTLTDTEQRAAVQQNRYESIDLHDRLEEIRRRQQALRELVGVVSEKRRAVEPVFGELKDRLRQLDRWLADLETDDNKNSLANRMSELNQNVSLIHTRHDMVQQSLADIRRRWEARCRSWTSPDIEDILRYERAWAASLMVIDTSAIVAIALNEPEATEFEQRTADDPVRLISAATALEVTIVLETRLGDSGGRDSDLWLHKVGAEVVPVDAEQMEAARRAWRRYGKGRHPAALNFGDCFSYALALIRGEPLLLRGRFRRGADQSSASKARPDSR